MESSELHLRSEAGKHFHVRLEMAVVGMVQYSVRDLNVCVAQLLDLFICFGSVHVLVLVGECDSHVFSCSHVIWNICVCVSQSNPNCDCPFLNLH